MGVNLFTVDYLISADFVVVLGSFLDGGIVVPCLCCLKDRLGSIAAVLLQGTIYFVAVKVQLTAVFVEPVDFDRFLSARRYSVHTARNQSGILHSLDQSGVVIRRFHLPRGDNHLITGLQSGQGGDSTLRHAVDRNVRQLIAVGNGDSRNCAGAVQRDSCAF